MTSRKAKISLFIFERNCYTAPYDPVVENGIGRLS